MTAIPDWYGPGISDHLVKALNAFWEGRPLWGSRNKDCKLRAELIRIIQRSYSDSNNVIGIEIMLIVDRRVDKQAATASPAEGAVDSCAVVCNYLVASGCTPTQFEGASRPANDEYLVGASE
jgi:hypothetical protein